MTRFEDLLEGMRAESSSLNLHDQQPTERAGPMDFVTYLVSHISPVLMHSPKGMQEEKPETMGKKEIPTAEQEAEAGAYRSSNGQLFIPAEAFRKSLIRAGAGRRIGKVGASTALAGSVYEVDLECPLFNPTTKKPLKNYDIDIRRAVVQRQGIRRARAMLNEWACHMKFEYDPDFIKVDWITEVFEIAGKTKGVLDYRPEKGGRFGRYNVALV